MNTLKALAPSLALLLVTAFSTSRSIASMQGPGGTGGGKGVVCRTTDGKINSVELLDLWEAKNIHSLSIQQTALPIETQVANALKSLSESVPADDFGYSVRPAGSTKMNNYSGKEAVFQVLSRNAASFLRPAQNSPIKFLRSVTLTPTLDSYEVALPSDCGLEQIVRYEDTSYWNGSVLINADLFDRLDTLNQAALISHEALYKWLRDQYGETSSLRVRREIGLALSGHRFNTLHIDALPSQYYVCETKADRSGDMDSGIKFSRAYFFPTASLDPSKVNIDFNVTDLNGLPILDDAPNAQNPKLQFPVSAVGDLSPMKGYKTGEIELTSLVQPEMRASVRIDDASAGNLKVSFNARSSVFFQDGMNWTPAECKLVTK